MALGDITILSSPFSGTGPVDTFKVSAGTTASINAGEPVLKALGSSVVAALATNKPVVGTDYLAGISTTDSDETASAAGYVSVLKLVPGVVYLCNANSAAAVDTQAEYDALVGDRVLFDLTNGTYTVLTTDGATNGLVIEPLDITKYPGKIAFSIRSGCAYFA